MFQGAEEPGGEAGGPSAGDEAFSESEDEQPPTLEPEPEIVMIRTHTPQGARVDGRVVIVDDIHSRSLGGGCVKCDQTHTSVTRPEPGLRGRSYFRNRTLYFRIFTFGLPAPDLL